MLLVMSLTFVRDSMLLCSKKAGSNQNTHFSTISLKLTS